MKLKKICLVKLQTVLSHHPSFARLQHPEKPPLQRAETRNLSLQTGECSATTETILAAGTKDSDEMNEAMKELRRAEFLANKKREEEARLQAKVVDDDTKERARLFIKKKELMKSPSKKAFEKENGIGSVSILSPKSSQKSPAPIRRRISERTVPMRRKTVRLLHHRRV